MQQSYDGNHYDTWCVDKINKDDVGYILKTPDTIVLSRKELEGMRQEKEAHHDGIYISDYQNGYNALIDELLGRE